MRTLLLAFLLLGCKIAVAQTNQDIQLDEINSDNILVKDSFNKVYDLGSKKNLQTAFGKPKKIVKERDDVQGGYGYTYQYKGLETYFNEKNWEATTVTSKSYKVLLNNVPYKIGDNINKFKKQFPLSFANREHRGKGDNAFHIIITGADAFIYVKYDDSGIITEITIANDNS